MYGSHCVCSCQVIKSQKFFIKAVSFRSLWKQPVKACFGCARSPAAATIQYVSTVFSGASSFMIHNTLHSLCLENSLQTGLVQMQKCNLDSDLQQWMWMEQSVLKSVGTGRCLSAHYVDPVQTVSCGKEEDRGNGLLWDCEGNRLTSQNTSLELSTDGKRLTLSHRSRQSKWRSLDEGDICQEKLSKSLSKSTILWAALVAFILLTVFNWLLLYQIEFMSKLIYIRFWNKPNNPLWH